MTNGQIEILKMLGYTETMEEGAILSHPEINGMDGWVWNDAQFNDIVLCFTPALLSSHRKEIASEVAKG